MFENIEGQREFAEWQSRKDIEKKTVVEHSNEPDTAA